MQYYTERHRHTCGVDLHGRNLYLCVLDQDREIVLHRRVDCDEEKVMRVLAPYREDLVVGVECMFKWYWLAGDRSSTGRQPVIVTGRLRAPR